MPIALELLNNTRRFPPRKSEARGYSPAEKPKPDVINLTEELDALRVSIAAQTPQRHKSALGQFMTPGVISEFMASLFEPLYGKRIRLLDAGAGIGSLTVGFAIRAAKEHASSLQCEAWEIDSQLHVPLNKTLDACALLMEDAGVSFCSEIKKSDFIQSHSDLFDARPKMQPPTHAILNPPYKKIASTNPQRFALRKYGIETTNLYSAFVALALKALDHRGELVAITPRSFCNGTYFRPFRELILEQSAVIRVHVFESRTHAFKDDEVLQENVIFHLIKGGRQGSVTLSTSADASFAGLKERSVPFEQIVLPGDREKIFHLATEETDEQTSQALNRYCYTLEQIGLSVSTGPVVDFRMRNHLRTDQCVNCAPMVYAHHFDSGFIAHPKQEAKKPNWIEVNDETRKWLMPGGFYVAIRRLSSKEEKRRIVPAVFDPSMVSNDLIGFDNKTNIVHRAKQGMDETLAKGMAVYLGSTFADQWLRRFSGHTQVNAGDLRAMRYPDLHTLHQWGSKVGHTLPSQEEIDELVGGA